MEGGKYRRFLPFKVTFILYLKNNNNNGTLISIQDFRNEKHLCKKTLDCNIQQTMHQPTNFFFKILQKANSTKIYRNRQKL